MSIYDRLRKKHERTRRNYNISDNLYDKLSVLSQDYEDTVPDIINICIDEFIKNESNEKSISINQDFDSVTYTRRSILIWKSNLEGLDILKNKYKISANKLVNLALETELDKIK